MNNNCPSILSKIKGGLYTVWRFYYEGFRDMTVGKTLWLIIFAKILIFFVIIKFLFFPDILKRDYDTDEERAEHVRMELTSR